MKTQTISKCIAFASIVLLISVQSRSAEQQAAAQPQSIGQIVWVKGTVKATGAANQTRPLQRRSAIYTKDTIVTEKGSTGEVVFSDNSVVSLQEDTQLRIDEYQFGKNVPAGKSKYVASLVKGGFRTITGLIPKDNPNNYSVHTPVATIAVQGTQYTAVYKGKLFMKYQSGKPCINNSKGRICLDAKNPYAAAAADSSPVRLQSEPSVFKNDLDLTPASFNPNGAPGGPESPSGPPGGKSGVVGSFCIG